MINEHKINLRHKYNTMGNLDISTIKQKKGQFCQIPKHPSSSHLLCILYPPGSSPPLSSATVALTTASTIATATVVLTSDNHHRPCHQRNPFRFEHVDDEIFLALSPLEICSYHHCPHHHFVVTDIDQATPARGMKSPDSSSPPTSHHTSNLFC